MGLVFAICGLGGGGHFLLLVFPEQKSPPFYRVRGVGWGVCVRNKHGKVLS